MKTAFLLLSLALSSHAFANETYLTPTRLSAVCRDSNPRDPYAPWVVVVYSGRDLIYTSQGYAYRSTFAKQECDRQAALLRQRILAGRESKTLVKMLDSSRPDLALTSTTRQDATLASENQVAAPSAVGGNSREGLNYSASTGESTGTGESTDTSGSQSAI